MEAGRLEKVHRVEWQEAGRDLVVVIEAEHLKGVLRMDYQMMVVLTVGYDHQ